MKFEFDFVVTAWMKNVIIEAPTVDEAKEKLLSMSLEDLVDLTNRVFDGATVADSSISDLDTTLLEATYRVKVFNIQYELDDDNYLSDDKLEKLSAPREYIISEVEDEDDLYDLIEERLIDESDLNVADFDFKIIEKY